MKVQVLSFGMLKSWIGKSMVELDEGATVADLLAELEGFFLSPRLQSHPFGLALFGGVIEGALGGIRRARMLVSC